MKPLNIYPFSEEENKERIEEIKTIASTKEKDAHLLKQLYSFIDLTSLGGKDNRQSIGNLCLLALLLSNKVAAVCVYPVFTRFVKSLLKDSGIRTVAVAGAFPSGQSPFSIRLAEVEWTLQEGANEIDIVINRGKFLEGKTKEVFDEIKAIVDVAKEIPVKVILETGALESKRTIRKAGLLAMEAGAAFLKTSTGKITPAATPEAALVMCDTILEFYHSTGKKIGFKPAGGIQTPSQAILYYTLVEQVLGPEWLKPQLFRIGASHLVKALIESNI